MGRSRKDAWLRDELILALDLYRREGRNPQNESARELSEVLRSIPIEPHLADEPRFRNVTGVKLKVSNFVAIDPTAETTGMTRGGRGDQEVWGEFASDPDGLSRAAQAIRANLTTLTPPEAETEEEDIADGSRRAGSHPYSPRPGAESPTGRSEKGGCTRGQRKARL